MLSPRERYLMREAFQTGYSRGHNDTVEGDYNESCVEEDDCFNEWVDDEGTGTVTTADILSVCAPTWDK